MKKFYKSLSLLLGFVSFASWSDSCGVGLMDPSKNQPQESANSVPPITASTPGLSPLLFLLLKHSIAHQQRLLQMW